MAVPKACTVLNSRNPDLDVPHTVAGKSPQPQLSTWKWRKRWRHARSERRGLQELGLPKVDWSRYHLQVLFVDKRDSLRSRTCAAVFERLAEWNGYGRALYPATAGIAPEAAGISTTAGLMAQVASLGLDARQHFARALEQFEAADFDRFNVIVALDREVQEEVRRLAGRSAENAASNEEQQQVLPLLSQFSTYCSSTDLLKQGGSGVLDDMCHSILKRGAWRMAGSTGPDVPRPDLTRGVEEWNEFLVVLVTSCAGLVQFLIDSYPPDLPEYDPC